MGRQSDLDERVAILEERLKFFELPDHKRDLADSTAMLRSARARSKRLQRTGLIVAAIPAVFWVIVDLILLLR